MTRRTRRKPSSSYISKSDRWVIVASIDAIAVEVGKCYEVLPGRVQAGLLRLGHELGKVRKRLARQVVPP